MYLKNIIKKINYYVVTWYFVMGYDIRKKRPHPPTKLNSFVLN